VRTIKFSRKNGKLVLDSYFEEILPAGVVSSGEINNKDLLVKVLSSIKSKSGAGFVRCSLPDEKAYFFPMDFVPEPGLDIRQNVEFHMEENVPVSPQDAIFSLSVFPNKKAKSGKIHANVCVVQKETAERYADILYKASLTPVSFLVSSQAAAKAVVPRKNCSSCPCIVTCINGTKSIISIVDKGEVRFSSTSSVGGEALLYSENTDTDKKTSKNELAPGRRTYLNGNAVKSLNADIAKVIEYWESRDVEGGMNPQEEKIKKVIFCGETISREDLSERLSLDLNIAYEIGNVWVNAFSFNDTIPELPADKSLDYAAAIGLALPDF
jgi:Tfp pilus assembly PilM family ATPase